MLIVVYLVLTLRTEDASCCLYPSSLSIFSLYRETRYDNKRGEGGREPIMQ